MKDIKYVELKCDTSDSDYLIIQENKEKDNYVVWIKPETEEIFVSRNQLENLIKDLEEMVNE